MEARGLIERAEHPSDARSVLLQATPSGRRRYAAVRRAIVLENEAALRGLSAAERARFIKTLRRFSLAAQRRIRGEEGE
jgi:DNA-binding MarR family transcriptional regulator